MCKSLEKAKALELNENNFAACWLYYVTFLSFSVLHHFFLIQERFSEWIT